MVFEVVLDDVAEEFCFCLLFDDFVVDTDLDWFWIFGIEDGVVSFGWVWNEVVVMEVVDEVSKF